MNTPSPLVPKGTSPEPRRKSHFAAVFIILFIHVGVLAGFLLQGCKPDEPTKSGADAGNPPTFGSDAASTNAASPLAAAPEPIDNLGLPGAIPPPGVPSGASPASFGVSSGLPAALPSGGAPGLAPLPGGGAPSPLFPGGLEGAAPSTARTSSTPSTEHTVMKGETGGAIAKKYGMGWKAVEAANPGVDSRRLRIGQKLLIPAKTVTSTASPISSSSDHHSGAADSGAGSYTIKSGDTLGKIARRNGLSVKALKAANGLKLDAIKVGAKLHIPGKATAAPAEPAAPAPLTLPPPLPRPSQPAARGGAARRSDAESLS